jgi:hypothetical protein
MAIYSKCFLAEKIKSVRKNENKRNQKIITSGYLLQTKIAYCRDQKRVVKML